MEAASRGRCNNLALRVLPVALPFALVVLIGLHRITMGELGPAGIVGDEKTHACTGQFFASLLRDLPLSHPLAYAYHYYAQYPALGVVQYPPLFYLFEGIVFLAFGASILAARLAVLFFALLAAYFWFRLVRELAGTWAASVSAGLLVCLPGLVPFEKSVMLEIPTLALCIAASFFWVRYLRGQRAGSLYAFAVAASLALLTKQNAIYLPVFCLLSALALRRWRLLWARRAVYAFLIVCVLAGPAYLVEYVVQGHSVRLDMAYAVEPLARSLPLGQWLFYPGTLPATLGWPLLILAVAGVLAATRRRDREPAAVMLCWIAACWLTFSLIPHQEARYICYWLPPFAFFAAEMLNGLRARRALRPLASVAAAVVLMFYAAKAWAYQRPYVEGYAAAARQIARSGYHGIVMTDIELPGNFIFFVRKDDPGRHIAVMRKGLYVERYFPAMGYSVLAGSRQQILSLLSDYGIRYIVVEKGMPVSFEAQNVLRSILENPRFREIGGFPIQSNDPEWRGRSLSIYEDTQAGPPAAKIYKLKMLTMSHDIEVPMAGLFR